MHSYEIITNVFSSLKRRHFSYDRIVVDAIVVSKYMSELQFFQPYSYHLICERMAQHSIRMLTQKLRDDIVRE